MGKKKGGKDKKGKGAEKTLIKTEKNANRKAKKLLKEKGEKEIETLLAEYQGRPGQKLQYEETKCSPPSPRCNMTLTAIPEKDEILMFGGEYFNGSQTFLYDDLYSYHIRTGEWVEMRAPVVPPPRCSHQAVAVHQAGGQLWVFGGEFASPTQSQFYHYSDLWCFALREKKWKKINAPGGPSSRSGHRMILNNKLLFVFGGFHDNTREYRYYSDVHAFCLGSMTWLKLDITGSPPPPRSGCLFAGCADSGQLLVYGGYSKEKVKRDVDRGHVHTDMYSLTPVRGRGESCSEGPPLSYTWRPMKQSGARPSPRSGASLVSTATNRALVFGGVHDKEEGDEDLEGVFYHDLYSLEVEKGRWHELHVRGKKSDGKKRRRRRKSEGGEEEGEEEEAMEEEVRRLTVSEEAALHQPSRALHQPSGALHQQSGPCGRMNAQMTVKNNVLFVYGGLVEEGARQITLSDLYCLDLHRLDEWRTLIENTADKQVWIESDDDDDDDDMEDDEDGAAASDEDEDDDTSSEEEMELDGDPPPVTPGESAEQYFAGCEDFWLRQAAALADREHITTTERKLRRAALKMAAEYVETSQ